MVLLGLACYTLNFGIVVRWWMVFVGVIYPGYRGLPVTTQNSGYDQFVPAANGWGTIHPILENGPITPG
jgi:hypothetical protein